MIDRPHCIERVRRRTRTSQKAGLCFTYSGIAVSHAATNAKCSRMSDQFGRSGQFGSNRHKANLPLCRLPKTIEQRDGRSFQKSLGMYATFQMREKGALKMYSQRSSTIV